MRTISIGEVLWDVFGAKEFLGGAPLNFSANLQRLGNSVVLLSAVGDDSRGNRALEQMRALGLTTEFVQIVTERPTGTAAVVTDSSGSATFVFERPAAFDLVHPDDENLARLRAFSPDWIYFGTLAQTDARNEEILLRIIQCSGDAKRFYDMNLRAGHWDLNLVHRLSRIATVLKLNDAEAELLFQLTFGNRQFNLDGFCQHWSSTYGVKTICVTLGSKGCAVFTDGSLRDFPGYRVAVADTVGAGDAFAAAFLHGLHLGWPIERIATFANSLGAHVASRPGATPPWTLDEVELTASSAEVRILN
jgi:fructokinase